MEANSFGVCQFNFEWGREPLQSFSQMDRAARACASVVNNVSFKNSSRRRPLKDSMKPFCIGLPSAM